MRVFLFVCICVMLPGGLLAQTASMDTLKYCVSNGSLGTGGYDPVSYFSGAPQKGLAKHSAEFDHVKYVFASEQNRKKFLRDPEKYLPQFGGWCSMTLALGRATTPSFENFLIDGGKLYLFERTLSVNGKELWLTAPDKNKALASKNYSTIVSGRKGK